MYKGPIMTNLCQRDIQGTSFGETENGWTGVAGGPKARGVCVPSPPSPSKRGCPQYQTADDGGRGTGAFPPAMGHVLPLMCLEFPQLWQNVGMGTPSSSSISYKRSQAPPSPPPQQPAVSMATSGRAAGLWLSLRLRGRSQRCLQGVRSGLWVFVTLPLSGVTLTHSRNALAHTQVSPEHSNVNHNFSITH
jgi:hypothetical protein